MDYKNQQTLLQGLQKGETAAFEYLRKKSYGFVAKLCNSNSRFKEDPEDLYSEGIENLLHRIAAPNYVLKGKVHALLVTICRNKNIDNIRSEDSSLEYLDDIPEYSYDAYLSEDVEQSFYRDILQRNIKKLTENCQKILNKFMDGLNINEVAEDLGLTPMYVKKRKSICKKALYEYMDEDPDYRSAQ